MSISPMKEVISNCRTCLRVLPVIEYTIFDTEVKKMLTSCTDIQINKVNIHFPEGICPNCYSQLVLAYNFRNLVHSSEKKLEERLLNLTKDSEADSVEEMKEHFQTVEMYEPEPETNMINEEILIKEENHEELSISNDKCDHSHALQTKESDLLADKMFLCTCGKTFPWKSPVNFDNQMDNVMKCRFCPKTFSSSKSCQEHERIHMNRRLFTCKFCSDKFTSQDDIIIHMETHQNLFKCDKDGCRRTFKNYIPYLGHIKKHEIEERSKKISKELKKRQTSHATASSPQNENQSTSVYKLKKFLPTGKDLEDIILKNEKDYKNAIKCYEYWCNNRQITDIGSETVLLEFFRAMGEHRNPKSIDLLYRRIMLMMAFKNNVDISGFSQLFKFIEIHKTEYKPVEVPIFSEQNINDFVKNAPNDYIVMKVALVLGVFGKCTAAELADLQMTDVKVVGKTKNYIKMENHRNCHVISNPIWVQIVKEYLELRKNLLNTRFLLVTIRGKLVDRRLTSGTVGKYSKKIATFLGLPNAESYSSQSIRMSLALSKKSTK